MHDPARMEKYIKNTAKLNSIPATAKYMQILHWMIIPMVLLATVAFYFVQGVRNDPMFQKNILMLTIINGIMTPAMIVLSIWFSRFVGGKAAKQLERRDEHFGLTGQFQPVRYWASRISTQHLLRMSYIGGAALWGATICYQGFMNGRLAEEPIYWLNATPVVIFLAYALLSVPTQARLEKAFAASQGTTRNPYETL